MMRRDSRFVNVRFVLVLTVAALVPALSGSQTSGPLTTKALIAKLRWRSVGPYIGGRVVTVTGVPGNPNLFYAGAVGGGVWRSADEGVEWKNITDGKLPGPSSSIGAVAVAPSDPNTIYVGTGEADIRSDVIPGDGVFKSTDAGNSWQYAGLRDTHSISAIVVDPRDPNVVYAASMGHVFKSDPDRGVFKSIDGGKSWNKILFVDENTGAICLVMDPNHADVLYTAMWQAQRMPWGLSSGGAGFLALAVLSISALMPARTGSRSPSIFRSRRCATSLSTLAKVKSWRPLTGARFGCSTISHFSSN